MGTTAKFAMYVKFQAHAGQREALVNVLSEAAAVVGEIPECEMYLVSTPPDDDNAVCVIEAWTSEEAHRESLQRDDVRAIVQRGMPLIDGVRDQIRLTPIAGRVRAPQP